MSFGCYLNVKVGTPAFFLRGRAEIMDSAHAGGLGGTFGGSPTAVAAAVAVMEQGGSAGDTDFWQTKPPHAPGSLS